jgi:excisionase family DNA binding protein
MEMTASTPVLVGRSEAAKMLGISRATLRRLVKRGALEEVRLAPGMHPKIRVEDILALAHQQREGP